MAMTLWLSEQSLIGSLYGAVCSIPSEGVSSLFSNRLRQSFLKAPVGAAALAVKAFKLPLLNH
jgi:hypothetical protein